VWGHGLVVLGALSRAETVVYDKAAMQTCRKRDLESCQRLGGGCVEVGSRRIARQRGPELSEGASIGQARTGMER
jgi:hypothetical protein